MKEKFKKVLSYINRYGTIMILVAVLVVSALAGILILKPPAIDSSIAYSNFDPEIAIDHIYNISKQPHSSLPEDETAHTEVREYLVDTATDYIASNPAASVEVRTYDNTYSIINTDGEEEYMPYDIDNVLVKIPGKSDTGILLMSHYDSRGHIGRGGELGGSYGAIDDGYGLATLLEILRTYGAETDLENSIYILFTDGEETGLYGASAELKYNQALMDNVNFVINIEARGASGVAYMFETGKNNLKTMQFYNTTKNKITYSLATAVYQIMPNYTDFTPYIEAGYAGMNFCALDDFYVYHTPDDNYSNINASTLAHYSAQILPLVEEYAFNSEYSDINYFNGSSDAISFNYMPGEIVVYDFIFAIILLGLGIAAFAFLVFIKNKKEKIAIKNIFIKSAKVGGVMLLFAVFGFIISQVLASIYAVTFSLTYTRITGINSVLYLSILGLFIAAGAYLKKKSNQERLEYQLAINVINFIFATLTTFILPGASFLFLIPALASTLSLIGSHYIKNRFKTMPQMLSIMVICIFFIPILYSLYIALTVGALAVILLLAVMPVISMLATILDLHNDNEVSIIENVAMKK